MIRIEYRRLAGYAGASLELRIMFDA